MKLISFLVLLCSLSFGNEVLANSVVLALQCYGAYEETYTDDKGVIKNNKAQEVVRHYELSNEMLVEHISTHIFNRKRVQIEAGDDESRKHSGYYRLDDVTIAYNESTEWRVDGSYSHRSFQINRKTGRWAVQEFYGGGLFWELMSRGAGKVRKQVVINGDCGVWEGGRKF